MLRGAKTMTLLLGVAACAADPQPPPANYYYAVKPRAARPHPAPPRRAMPAPTDQAPDTAASLDLTGLLDSLAALNRQIRQTRDGLGE